MNLDEAKYCILCGTELEKQFRFGQERPLCPSCGWVFFPDPKVAAAVVVKQEDKILLVRRTNQPERGKWTLPAGFVDAGEDPASAAERECLEETGLIVQVTGLLDVLYGLEHERGAHILIVYSGELISGNIRPSDDADRAEFFSPNSLPPLAFRTTELILFKDKNHPSG
ncbi:MAG: NUDIX domain-containing protein [Chloroflexi bacterium]|nr:MAG: NUDIX domain-containing protein [Chloroflexota bacterium]